MQHICWVFGVAGCLVLAVGLQAQTSGSPAATLAERDYAEERYRQLRDMTDRLAAAQTALDAKLESLMTECRRLQREISRRPDNYLTRENLRPLEKKIQDLSGKYEADKREIVDRLERLAKAVSRTTAETKAPAKPLNTRKAKAAPKSPKP